jgi:hypothetical protein
MKFTGNLIGIVTQLMLSELRMSDKIALHMSFNNGIEINKCFMIYTGNYKFYKNMN